MKKTIILLIVTTLLFSCNQNKNKNKTDVFFANFEAKSLPLDFPNSEIDNFNELDRVLPEFLDMLVDTTGKMIKTDDGWHYTTDYFFKYHISTDKDFDIIILGEYPCSCDGGEVLAEFYYDLFTISPKTGEIFDKIKLAYNYIDVEENKISNAVINDDLSINIKIEYSVADGIDVEEYELITTDLKYIIKDNGTIKRTDSLVNREIIQIENEGQNEYSSAQEMMEDLLLEDKIEYVYNIVESFKNCKTAKQLKDFISQENEFLAILNEMFFKYDPEVSKDLYYDKMFQEYIPFIYVGYGAEGSCIEANYNFYNISQKALETTGIDDDVFFEAYKTVYQEQEWGERTLLSDWDVFFAAIDFETSYSKLGNNVFINAFKAIQTAKAKTELFSENLDDLKSSVFSDLIFDYGKFAFSKDKILDELTIITNEIDFTPEEKEELDKFINYVTNLSSSEFDKGEGY